MNATAACAVLAAVLVGCGSTSTSSGTVPSPQSTAASVSTYRDPVYRFSFQLPPGWAAAKRGLHQNFNGVMGYVLPIGRTHHGVEITVLVAPSTNPDVFIGQTNAAPQGHKVRVSGHPATEFVRTFKDKTQRDTLLVVGKYTYDVRAASLQHVMPKAILSAYHEIVRTFKVGNPPDVTNSGG